MSFALNFTGKLNDATDIMNNHTPNEVRETDESLNFEITEGSHQKIKNKEISATGTTSRFSQISARPMMRSIELKQAP